MSSLSLPEAQATLPTAFLSGILSNLFLKPPEGETPVSQSSFSIITFYHYGIFLVAHLNLPSCDVPGSDLPPAEILGHCGFYQAFRAAWPQVSLLVALLQNC